MNTDPQISNADPSTNQGVKEAYRLILIELQQIEEAQRNLAARHQSAIAAKDALLRLMPPQGVENENGQPESSTTAKREKPVKHHQGSLTGNVVMRSKEILRAAGRPLERGELLEAIEKSGLKVEATNPPKFIGRALWESKQFVHVDKVGYWIKGEQLPTSK